MKHATPLSYFRGSSIAPNSSGGLQIRGPWSFEVIVFHTPAAAKMALSPRLVTILRQIHQPLARAGNVVVVATTAVAAANHNVKLWHRTLDALSALK